jgi:hypothetical protein
MKPSFVVAKNRMVTLLCKNLTRRARTAAWRVGLCAKLKSGMGCVGSVDDAPELLLPRNSVDGDRTACALCARQLNANGECMRCRVAWQFSAPCRRDVALDLPRDLFFWLTDGSHSPRRQRGPSDYVFLDMPISDGAWCPVCAARLHAQGQFCWCAGHRNMPWMVCHQCRLFVWVVPCRHPPKNAFVMLR